MQFVSDNAAGVHPKVWDAMRSADSADFPYDGDRLSARLDAVFTDIFAQECSVIWVASGTAANGLALATMVAPHSAVICHRLAHVANSECGAPAFYTHGAGLMLAEGDGAKLSPDAIAAEAASVRGDVHQPRPQAVSITQATELGLVYRPTEVAAIGDIARANGMKLHMDGARFANAVAFLGCSPGEASCAGGVEALSFGCVKNGGMGAEALVFFDPEMADLARFRRKRAGHLQSKGRFLAAQILALVEGGLWLENAHVSNSAAQEIGAGAGGRLRYPIESNQLFVTTTPQEREALRAQGFVFYDWGSDAARIVTAWDSNPAHVAAFAKAIAAL